MTSRASLLGILLLSLLCAPACKRGYGLADPVTCPNGILDPGEDCDGAHLGGSTCQSLGLGDGSLACLPSCRFDVTGCSLQADCGNGLREYPETCDGTDLGGATCESLGLSDGTLGCAPSCELDATGCLGSVCGDGIISGQEKCDGEALGEETCRSQGYYGGSLACTPDCEAFDLSGCNGYCGDGERNGPELCDEADFGNDSCLARGFYEGSLSCASDCQTVDDSDCRGSCGDGVINGAEVCDGESVGVATCDDYGLGGTLLCLSDCSGVDVGSCTSSELLITEIGLGNPDYVELLNVSGSPIDLDGWSLEWWGFNGSNQAVGGVLIFPAYELGPGERVVINDEYPGSEPAPPPTVDPMAGTIDFHVNIWWGASPGAVALWDPGQEPVDFARWGGQDFDPPSGAQWQDIPNVLPGTNRDDIALSRVPDGTDTDQAADWCRAPATPGATNAPCFHRGSQGRVLITEVSDDQPLDRVELYNPGSTAVNLLEWLIYATNGSPTNRLLPAFELGPGEYVAVIDDAPGAAYVDFAGIHVGNLNIAPGAGVVMLVDGASMAGVDFLRWGTFAMEPAAPDSWADSPDPLPGFPVFPSPVRSLGRRNLTDTNTSGDWCFMEETMGAANGTCDP